MLVAPIRILFFGRPCLWKALDFDILCTEWTNVWKSFFSLTENERPNYSKIEFETENEAPAHLKIEFEIVNRYKLIRNSSADLLKIQSLFKIRRFQF